MAITRAQQYRQMLENGGRGISLQEAKAMAPKGEFLAYINKKEAKMLKDAGGSGIMTNAGIPSYNPNEDRAREEARNENSARERGAERNRNQNVDRKNPGGYNFGGEGEGDNAGNTNYGISPGRSKAQYGTTKYAGLTETQARDRNAQDNREKARIAEQTKIAKQTAVNKAKREKFLADQKKERERVEKEKRREKIISLANIPTPFNIAKKVFGPVIDKNNIAQKKNYLDYLSRTDPEKFQKLSKELVDEDLATADMLASDDSITSPSQRFGASDFKSKSLNVNEERLGDEDVKDILGTGYTDYLNRFNTTDDRGDNDGSNQLPPIISQQPITPVTPLPVVGPTTSSNPFSLAPRFMGSIFDFSGGRTLAADGGIMMMKKEYRDLLEEDEMDDPTGGIMDLESVRDMYFVGGLVKSAKKAIKGATRAVKKVAKSPIGKAALGLAAYKLGGGFLKGGGQGSIFSKLFGANNTMKGFADISTAKMPGFLSKLGLTQGHGSMMPTAMGGILGATTLAGLITPKAAEEDDDFEDKYRASQEFNIPKYRYGDYLAPRFKVADGGRINYAEGSEEPVAKKTMPLLDMDGQEMDLREEGGFVPLGRMERADDVPARLSKNEFVFTADAVRNAGEGDIDKGAEVMYNMMKNLESGGEVSEESQGLEGAREMFQTSQRLEEVL